MLKQLVKQWTATPVVGVDLGSAAIKVVELERTGTQLLLRRGAVTRLEHQDAIGALQRVVSQANVMTSYAAVGLASPELVVKPFTFPAMPKRELASAIMVEAEATVLNGHTMRDMAVDWSLLSGTKEAVRGLLAVVPKAVLNARLTLVKAAGLRPAVVDAEGLALWNAYWTLVGAGEAEGRTVLLINIGERTTNLVIARGPDELMLVRDLQLGGQALQAEQADEWSLEVQDSLSYARSSGGLRTLDAAYVTGGASGPQVLPRLKSVVSAPITFWNPLDSLSHANTNGSVKLSDGPALAVAIGLALRQPR